MKGAKKSVDLILDQCEVALRILQSNFPEKLINDLVSSKGYRWFKERENAMEQGFSDDDFLYFLLSDELGSQTVALTEALDYLQRLDLNYLASQAREYLPKNTKIESTIVPLIKPSANSFAYPVEGKIVIFLYLDPVFNALKINNTIVHELHHVGLNSVYADYALNLSKLANQRTKNILRFTQPLGEGYAMLAAAGGPNTHPNAHDPKLRELWDERMNFFERDFKAIDCFLRRLHELDERKAIEKGMEMMGIQGPWYTVGWQTAVVIEKILGRDSLISCIAEPAQLFLTYNQVVNQYNQEFKTTLPPWSEELIILIKSGEEHD